MACLDEIPITIERRRILFGAGTIISPTPICTTADNECCSDGGDPTCCDGEFTAELAATLTGPLDGSCGDEVVSLTLTWDATDQRWYGEGANALATYSLRVWFACVNGVYKGTVQVLDTDGALIDESPDVVLAASADCSTLDGTYTPVGDLAPCADDVTVSVDHPCPTIACGGEGVPCCPEGFESEVSVDIIGVGVVALIYDGTFDVWTGVITVDDESFTVFLWCNSDGSWTGWIDYYLGGDLVASGSADTLAPGGDCTTLVGTITVDGTDYLAEFGHPCAPAPCSDPGGSRDLCGCTGVNDTLYITFYGALASYGTVTVTYVNPLLGWTVTPTAGLCNGGSSPIAFNCSTGTTWILSSPGSGAVPSTAFSATATATNCSPLSVTFSGTATGDCAGAWSATVSEIAP